MKEIHFLLRTVVGKVVEHHSRCANCVAILIIPTFFNIYIYLSSVIRLSLFVRSASELHTQYFFICFLILILLISSHYCTVLSDAISICFLPFFSLTRPFILCSHLYSHSGFVLFCFLSFFLFSSSHTHTAGFSPHVHAHA